MVTLIVLEFGHHLVFEIGSAHKLVRHLDLIEAALLQQFQVLFVADLTLFAFFQLLPCLVLDHGSVGVEVLSL